MNANKESIRLLLVDDEEEFLMATSQALRRRGFEVTVAPNGVTALEKISREIFDIVVLDVKMPDIDGIEVFSQIREQQPDLPVILLTGHPSTSDAFHTSKKGIADYISKPVDMDELAGIIKAAVAHSRQQSPESATEPDTSSDPKITVMIVDDEADLLQSLSRAFTRRAFRVLTAESGSRALEILENVLVDIMILDVKMPGMDGLEVLRRVKQKHPSIQVILLSGHPSVDTALEGINMGASEYMKKPAEIDELADTMRRLYRERQELLEKQQQKLIDEIIRRYPS